MCAVFIARLTTKKLCAIQSADDTPGMGIHLCDAKVKSWSLCLDMATIIELFYFPYALTFSRRSVKLKVLLASRRRGKSGSGDEFSGQSACDSVSTGTRLI